MPFQKKRHMKSIDPEKERPERHRSSNTSGYQCSTSNSDPKRIKIHYINHPYSEYREVKPMEKLFNVCEDLEKKARRDENQGAYLGNCGT
jgi:hypothetical protein